MDTITGKRCSITGSALTCNTPIERLDELNAEETKRKTDMQVIISETVEKYTPLITAVFRYKLPKAPVLYISQERLTEIALAIIGIESSWGRNCKRRHESGYEARYVMTNEKMLAYLTTINQSTGDAATSVGCMQVLWGTAWWLGFRGRLEELELDNVNIEYGVRYLCHLAGRPYARTTHGERAVIGRYNGMNNDSYISRVTANLELLLPFTERIRQITSEIQA